MSQNQLKHHQQKRKLKIQVLQSHIAVNQWKMELSEIAKKSMLQELYTVLWINYSLHHTKSQHQNKKLIQKQLLLKLTDKRKLKLNQHHLFHKFMIMISKTQHLRSQLLLPLLKLQLKVKDVQLKTAQLQELHVVN
jgi:hypothetical protein